ncbi:MAG: hypothetical protein H6739_32720 [Alphaproteobacteria bacterium]|nr:hypothetical protein [Alphaproteobacteria bacterium]
MRRTDLLVLGLAVANAALGGLSLRAALSGHTTYVFTPLVDVIPGSSVLSEEEALKIRQDLRHQIDARDMQTAYATLGSTLSLDDLLEGVASLDAAGLPLQGSQRAAIQGILADAQADHRALWAVQDEILQLEDQLTRDVAAVLEVLPSQTRAAARQQLEAPPGPPPGGPR